MKVLLDADVLLDVALQRENVAPASYDAVRWCQERPGSAVIAWYTVSNLYYILRRAQSDTVARRFIASLLRFSTVARGGTAAVRHALALPMADFEDALQVVAATLEGVDCIVTRNRRDYRGSPVSALEPQQFVTRTEKP